MGRVPVVVRVCGSAQRGVAPQVLGTDWSSTPGALEELKRLRLRQQTRNAKRPRALVSGLAPPFQDWHHLEEVATESTSSEGVREKVGARHRTQEACNQKAVINIVVCQCSQLIVYCQSCCLRVEYVFLGIGIWEPMTPFNIGLWVRYPSCLERIWTTICIWV